MEESTRTETEVKFVPKPNCKMCWGRGEITVIRHGRKMTEHCGCLRKVDE